MRRLIFFFIMLGFQLGLWSQDLDLQNSVRFSARAVTNGLEIYWKEEAGVTSYTLSRRKQGQTGYSQLGSFIPPIVSYVDTGVLEGERYEYRLTKTAPSGNVSGYMASGIKVMPEPAGKTVLLLIAENIHQALAPEIEAYAFQLLNENWQVRTLIVPAGMNVTDVKQAIIATSKEETNLSTLVLLGNIPVPYSGLIAPDGHTDHIGAWPCDAYYGDLNGIWTDQTVNNTNASGFRNDNVPEDGKFDQSITNGIELEIGRIDFSKLPAFSETEIELTKKYLIKNLNYRKGTIPMPYRGLIQNNFPGFTEAFGQSGVNNFSRMFGFDSLFYLPYKTTLQNNAYLWSYGCGAGNYTGASGIGNTFELPTENHKTIFTMLFGSYFGDWESENNYLRAALASGSTLTNVWAGRPHWYFQHMALGKNIGYSAKLTQNNAEFPSGVGGKSIHIALMGDPTLDMYPNFDAISDAQLIEENNNVRISWNTISDEDYDGYQLYYIQKSNNGDLIEKINTEGLITSQSYVLNCPQFTTGSKIMIKAVQLVNSGSGSFYNESQGYMINVNPIQQKLPEAIIVANLNYDLIELSPQVTNGQFEFWQSPGNFGNTTNPEFNFLFDTEGTQVICLTAKNDCYQVTQCDSFDIKSSLPIIEEVKTAPLCFGEKGRVEIKILEERATFVVTWMDGIEGLIHEAIETEAYDYQLATATGKSKMYSGQLSFPDSIHIFSTIISEIENTSKGSISLEIEGGTPPYNIQWDNGSEGNTLDHLNAGNYQVTITDNNNCTKNATLVVDLISSVTEEVKSGWEVSQKGQTIILTTDMNAALDVFLISAEGKKAGRFRKLSGEKDEWHMETENLTAGLYLICITTDRGSSSVKWMKYP